ncbi:MAG TPA: YtxH domain-containing protein [Ignavibacteria bacterium]|mgnify:CR=1 FL=1|nr:YtxH domain-containing protein [Ignavibacteria bacterium]
MVNKEKNTFSFVGGLLTGGIIGVLAGLLFAPKTGKKFRKEISEKTDELLYEANLIVENAKEKAADILADASKCAEKLADDGKKKVDSMLSYADEMLQHGKERVSDSISRIRGSVK